MLLQIDRQSGARDFSATGTDLPLNPAGLPVGTGPRPVVAVLGSAGRVSGLARHLPAGWSVRFADDVDGVAADELVLFAGPAIRDIALARRLLPSRTQIVALVDDAAPAEIVAGVLTAGADACVRGGQPAILASHLVACRRRQMAGRWAHVNQQDRR
ncbi:hypothetical protein GCM10010172_74210 [Paractinoplanes ferrugineus]|uniref:Uncharacterized protein n=1 Tax=Paractinoplanes ferrugineus TaxID=113564 RepID=A0A919J041_9ACTN|nr:hypothetical protein [Actinoplanes ferrugineus]GIE11423.1 hypothetical protein Afe05nite_32630 [Actinoplanes ferrugineus]